jgi:hypothetical protein
MNKQLAKYFFDETYKTFAFLVHDYNFDPPRLEVDEKISFAYVIFMGKNLAVECILDEREGDVTCKIARVINGTKTSYYGVDEKGVRVREALSSLLERRGVRELIFTRVTGLAFHDRIKVTLADFAQMLRKYGVDILADSPTALS